MNTTMLVKLVMLSALAGIVFFKPAKAETVNCVNITSVPAVITTQGVYCLKQHMPVVLSSGSAITVLVNNVIIDCNDYKIGNLAAGPANTAVGVSADGHLNVTVRNCGIRGFKNGVSLTNGDYRVENNRFDFNTETAILVSGDGSAIRHNEVINTGASTILGLTQFQAIFANGDIDVIDNNVNGVIAASTGNGNVYGILLQNVDASVIKGNRIRRLTPAGVGLRRGIWNLAGNHSVFEDNTVIMDTALLAGEGGIRCGGTVVNNASRDNTVLGTGLSGAALGLINCAPAGGDFTDPN